MEQTWKKTFAIIWSGQFLSVLSSSIVGYAVIFWLSIETRSAEVLALAAICGMLPQSVIGFFAGPYVDRWNRKRTMILSDMFIALCTLLLAVLFWCGTACTWHIYLLLACRSAGSAFHRPALQASIPLLAPHTQLTRIAGINQVISSVSDIAGPALGALLISLTGMGTILMLDVAGALIACTTLLFVRIPDPERHERKPDLAAEFREGIAAIFAVRGMPWLFGLAIAVLFFIMPVGVLFPLMTLEHFGGGTYEMSLIEIVWGAGALAGGTVMGLRNYRLNRILLINGMYVVAGLSFLLSGLLPASGYGFFALFTAAAGISSSVFSASFISVVQHRIPADVLGRVLSLYFSLSLLPAALGLLGTGFLAEEVGLHPTFVIAGCIICLLGITAFLIPSVRGIDRDEVAERQTQDPALPAETEERS